MTTELHILATILQNVHIIRRLVKYEAY